MYEICRFLAATTPRAPRKPRKPRGPAIKAGAACEVWGRRGVVVGRHDNGTWWLVSVEGGAPAGFARSEIKLV